MGEGTPIYISDPTWGNHLQIMEKAGLEVRRYRYFEPTTKGLDYDGMVEDLKAAPDGSIVLLHACAHNPSGVDPNPEQWKAISDVCKAGNHVVFFDCAYQVGPRGRSWRVVVCVCRMCCGGCGGGRRWWRWWWRGAVARLSRLLRPLPSKIRTSFTHPPPTSPPSPRPPHRAAPHRATGLRDRRRPRGCVRDPFIRGGGPQPYARAVVRQELWAVR